MPIKFLCDINDNTKVREYASFQELFDPHLNKYFSFGLTDAQWLTALKCLYTKENILNNFNAFFSPYYYSHRRERLTEAVNNLPEESLWLLAYCSNSNLVLRSGQVLYWPMTTEQAENVASGIGSILSADSKELIYWLHSFCSGSYLFNGHTPMEVVRLDLKVKVEFIERNGVFGFSVVQQPASDSYRKPLYQVFGYHENPISVLPNDVEKRLKQPCHKPLLGVELEFSTDYTAKQLIDAQPTLFGIFKSDGSVSGSKPNMVELVTLPLYYEEHQKNFAGWFKALDENHFDTSKKTTNGMHVHVDKRVFGNPTVKKSTPRVYGSLHLRKFTWFYLSPGNTPFIKLISERDTATLNQYARIPAFNNFETKGKAFARCIDITRSYRGTINLNSNKETVEVRLFKGIVSYATILKNLEFVEATIEFSREASIQSLTTSAFLSWLRLETPSNKYSTLKEFLKCCKAKLPEVSEYSDIFQHIFTEKNPSKIIEILKDKNVTITKTIESSLNKLVGGKTFTFRDGGLTLSRVNFGVLSHKDKEFINRYSRETAS